MLPTAVTPPFASTVASASLRSAPPAIGVELQQRVAVRRPRHERQRQRAARRHRRHRRRAIGVRSMRCHSLNTQKARVFVAGVERLRAGGVDRHRVLEERPGAVGGAARCGRDVLLHRARLLDVDGVERHELVQQRLVVARAAPAARRSRCAPERRRKSLKPSGLWHPSSAQPRWSSFGITLASKNVSPGRLDQRAERRRPSAPRVAQSRSIFQVSSSRDWKKTPPVWLTPPASGDSGPQQDLALLDRASASGRRSPAPGRS